MAERYFTPRGRLLAAITVIHRRLYRTTGGRIGGRGSGMDMLLLTTVGRRSGETRTVPLPYFRDGDRLVVIASFAANPKHPAWYLNLVANADVTVQVGRRSWPGRAEPATGEERDRIWKQVVAESDRYRLYQASTPRQIPVVVLNPA